MIGHLVYGQHPQGAVPLASWPTYSRVGSIVGLDTGSGMKRLRPYRVWPQDVRIQRMLRDDKDFLELIQMVVEAELLE